MAIKGPFEGGSWCPAIDNCHLMRWQPVGYMGTIDRSEKFGDPLFSETAGNGRTSGYDKSAMEILLVAWRGGAAMIGSTLSPPASVPYRHR